MADREIDTVTIGVEMTPDEASADRTAKALTGRLSKSMNDMDASIRNLTKQIESGFGKTGANISSELNNQFKAISGMMEKNISSGFARGFSTAQRTASESSTKIVSDVQKQFDSLKIKITNVEGKEELIDEGRYKKAKRLHRAVAQDQTVVGEEWKSAAITGVSTQQQLVMGGAEKQTLGALRDVQRILELNFKEISHPLTTEEHERRGRAFAEVHDYAKETGGLPEGLINREPETWTPGLITELFRNFKQMDETIKQSAKMVAEAPETGEKPLDIFGQFAKYNAETREQNKKVQTAVEAVTNKIMKGEPVTKDMFNQMGELKRPTLDRLAENRVMRTDAEGEPIIKWRPGDKEGGEPAKAEKKPFDKLDGITGAMQKGGQGIGGLVKVFGKMFDEIPIVGKLGLGKAMGGVAESAMGGGAGGAGAEAGAAEGGGGFLAEGGPTAMGGGGKAGGGAAEGGAMEAGAAGGAAAAGIIGVIIAIGQMIQKIIQIGVDLIKKLIEAVIESSAYLQGVISLIYKALMLFLMPIGNMFASIFMPLARKMLQSAAQNIKENGLGVGGDAYNGDFVIEGIKGMMESLVSMLPELIVVGIQLMLDAIGTVVVTAWNMFWKWVISSITDFFTGAINNLINIIDYIFPGFAEGLSNFMSGVGGFLGGIKTALTNILEGISNVLGALGEAIWNVIFTALEPMFKFVEGIWGTISGAIGEGLNKLLTFGGWLLEQIGAQFSNLGEKLGGFGDWISSTIKTWFSNGVGAIKDFGQEFWGKITGWFSDGVGAIKDFGTNIWTKITTWFSDGVGALKDFGTNIWTKITTWFSSGVGAIKDFGTNIWNKVTGWLSDGIGAVKDLGQWVWDTITGWIEDALGAATDFADSAGDFLGGLGDFLPLAEGGIVTKPTLALVGEAGPEAVIPLSGAGSVKLQPFNSAMSATSAGTAVSQPRQLPPINIYIQSPIYGVTDLNRAINGAIDDYYSRVRGY